MANIKKRLVNQQWPEGTKLSIYPKKKRGEEILININLPTGNINSLHNKAMTFDFIAPLLDLGNEKHTKETIAGKLDELKSTIDFSSSNGVFNINITTDKTHLLPTIALLNELLAFPTFPSKELEVSVRSSIASLEANRNDPSTVSLGSLRKNLYAYTKGHPKAYLSTDDKIAAMSKLTSNQIKALYKQHLSISDGYISIIGDVNPQEVSALLHDALKQFTNSVPYEKLVSRYHNKEGLIIQNETPDKANAQLYVVNVLNINKQHPDYLALMLANDIFGYDAFTSRIGARIRVKEGYSYSVGSGLQIPEKEEQGIFYAFAISAPENIEAVITAYKEEVNKVVDEGFTQEELNSAVQGYIKDRSRQWADDAAIAHVLIDSQKYNRDLDYYDETIEKIKALTVEELQAAFTQHIASKKMNIFSAGDFEKLKVSSK